MSIENRLAAKKRSKQAKARRTRNRIIKVVAVLALLALVALFGYLIFLNSMKKNASVEKYLNADGTIDADKALSYVDVADYKNIVVKREDNLPTKSQVQSKIDSFVDSSKETIATAGVAIAKEDSVVLSYKVVIDGKEVADKEAKSKNYTLGKGTISDKFDAMIVTKKVGDSFSFDVAYSADEKDEVLKGKTATYAGKIEKVVKTPKLDDALVEEKMGKTLGKDFPHTVDGLWQYYGDSMYKDNVDSYIKTQIVDTTKVKSYPYFYNLNEYYVQSQSFENYAANMSSSWGIAFSKYSLAGVSENDDRGFEKAMKKQAKLSTKSALAYQAIFEDAKLAKIDEAAIRKYLKDNDQDYDEIIKSNSKELLAQVTLQNVVFDYVKGLVKYEGNEKLFWVDDPKTEETEK